MPWTCKGAQQSCRNPKHRNHGRQHLPRVVEQCPIADGHCIFQDVGMYIGCVPSSTSERLMVTTMTHLKVAEGNGNERMDQTSSKGRPCTVLNLRGQYKHCIMEDEAELDVVCTDRSYRIPLTRTDAMKPYDINVCPPPWSTGASGKDTSPSPLRSIIVSSHAF